MPHLHVASLIDRAPVTEVGASRITEVTAAELPMLRGLSARRLVIAAGAVREPHWHVNANELSYGVRGTTLVTVFGDRDELSRFVVGSGQMFFVPSGALHTIENLGEGEAELIVALTHESPLEFGLAGSLGAMSDAVLGNTLDAGSAELAGRRHTTAGDGFETPERAPEATPGDRRPSRLLFDVEAQSPPISGPAGSARLARRQFWPALEGVAMYSLRITTSGMREPHWHPRTGEMGYVERGRARMTVLHPDGEPVTYVLRAGDVYFVPAAYPHQIENVGDEETHFLVFFDQAMPSDIGYRSSLDALRREVVAAAFHVPPGALPRLPETPVDPLLVARRNPLDPLR